MGDKEVEDPARIARQILGSERNRGVEVGDALGHDGCEDVLLVAEVGESI
jgi:hypothetical protein